MKTSFDYQAAKSWGYSDDEIMGHLTEKNPGFDLQAAKEAGYSSEEINEHLSTFKPKRSFGAKAGRVAAQYAIGAAENALLPYEIAVAPLSSKEAQQVNYRENVFQDIERLTEQKQTGVWDEQDELLLENLIGQIKDPEKTEKFVHTSDIGVRGLVEKATGVELEPEDFYEKAAHWMGFIKNPKNLIGLKEIGLNPKKFVKDILPSGSEFARGISTGAALQMAENGHLGPVGTLGAMIAGDIIGHAPKAAINIAKNPKKAAAQAVNFLTQNNSSRTVAKQLAEDFKKSNIKIDAGTLTSSPLVQFIQARASQSGLTGTALENFRKELSGQIIREYESIADSIGNIRFENNFQAAEAIQNALKVEEIQLNAIRKQTNEPRSLQGRISLAERPDHNQALLDRIAPQEFQNSYQAGENLKTAASDIRAPIKEEFSNRWSVFNNEVRQIPVGPQAELANELGNFIREHEGSLLLGESAPEARVLQAARTLSTRLGAESGLIGVSLEDLIKTKRTLSDIADFEFGGSNFKSAYKKLVGEVDRAIERTLEGTSPELLESFRELNAEYSLYKETFENKNVLPLFEPNNNDFNGIYTQYVSNADKLRSLEDMFHFSPRGEMLINQIKRDAAEHVINRPNVTERDLRNLEQMLGPQFEGDMRAFGEARQRAINNPQPTLAEQRSLDISARISPTEASRPLTKTASLKNVKEADISVRKKMHEFLKAKTPDQILKLMDSVEGIRKLKKALSLTKEGKKVFEDLSRYKLTEMIENKMKNAITEQLKLGTFSGLLKSAENKAIAKEILGKEAYERLTLLQKNSGRLAESAEKFFNASRSGTTLTDVGLVSSAVTGVVLGNPFLVIPVVAKVGGMRVISNLLADPKFLKYLEEAILTNNPKKFSDALKKMMPTLQKAVAESRNLGKD